ncbi:MAG: ThiF family adenylyltransferase [Sphingomonadales bacterium]|nr:ThiF family adenylyltransferase [Sphingomonadales bacterium]
MTREVPIDSKFDYGRAFVRNLGWVTEREQQILRQSRVAIAGMGGVGGSHLLSLARLGIGHFHIADFDTFDIANFNRQIGATVSSAGRPKAEVLAAMARDINPEAEIRIFDEGVTEDNIDAFLDGVDLFVDGFDFFVLDMRAKVFARCHELGIPGLIIAPLGMGAAYLNFMPGGMSFEEYFGFDGASEDMKAIKFLIGLGPKGLHRSYLIDPSRVDFANRRVPSTGMSCFICSGVAGVEALKVLLGRGRVRPVPCYQHFDPYRETWVRGRVPGGRRNPLQRLKCRLAYMTVKAFESRARPAEEELPEDAPVLRRILNEARWAPSGDNSQPWAFEITGELAVRVAIDREPGNVYQFDDGRPNVVAAGCLLETMAVAASCFGLSMEWEMAAEAPQLLLDVTFHSDSDIAPDPLAPFIPLRSVDRRPYRQAPLTEAEKAALDAAVGPEFVVHWYEARAERQAHARLNGLATRLRLSIPECRRVHRDVVRQEAFPREGMPAKSIGLDPLTTRLMPWVNGAWWRTKLLNRYLGGAWFASLQLDYRTGMACAAHFAVTWPEPPDTSRSPGDWIAAGRAMQRFWLEAERIGLVLQPSFAPSCFAQLAGSGEVFSSAGWASKQAAAIAERFQETVGAGETAVAFLGRIGFPKSAPVPSRSRRRPLRDLSGT